MSISRFSWGETADGVIPEKDWDGFRQAVHELTERWFSRDCDGDLPVDICLVDRSRYEPMHFSAIKYSHKKPFDHQRALEIAALNVRMASEQLDRIVRK